MLSSCFVFSKVKDVFGLHIKIQNLQNTLIKHNSKYVFLLLKSLCKVKKTLSQQFYILLILEAKEYYYCKK